MPRWSLRRMVGPTLSGTYSPRVYSRPEMDCNLENLQVLIEYLYWTRHD